jgi:hypothetical protein
MASPGSQLLRFWEWISEAGFIAVIFGVALEVADLWAKWYERCNARRLPKMLHRWLLPVETFGFSILIIGLAVEFLGSHKAMQIAERENSILAKDAADANKLAGLANERAASNELQVLKAQSALATLQLLVQWRTISPMQETNLIKHLKPFTQANSARVLVNVEGNNPESKWFANRIVDVLKQCGFNATLSGTSNFGVKSAEGIEIDVKSFQHAPGHAARIFDAFREEKLSIVISSFEDSRLPDDLVSVWVLPKPEKIWTNP